MFPIALSGPPLSAPRLMFMALVPLRSIRSYIAKRIVVLPLAIAMSIDVWSWPCARLLTTAPPSALRVQVMSVFHCIFR